MINNTQTEAAAAGTCIHCGADPQHAREARGGGGVVNPSELGSMWLRDRAETLRRDASKMERAYEGKLGAMCARVAAKYRAAAVLLDDAASELEDEAAP